LFIRISLTCLRQVKGGMNSIRRHVASTTVLNRSASVPFVIPSVAEGSAVLLITRLFMLIPSQAPRKKPAHRRPLLSHPSWIRGVNIGERRKSRNTPEYKDAWGMPAVGLGAPIEAGPHNGKSMSQKRGSQDSATCAWESFLHRPPLVLDRAKAASSLAGTRILVTGAGGWIGSALTQAIAGFAPQHLVLLEASERNLYEIEQQLPTPIRHTSIVGSVADPDLLADIFDRHSPQVIYHAAAFKHVPLMEQNPFAAIENNTIGTSLLAQAAAAHNAEQLILVSTDKAADPVSMMGASKRIAELILLAERGTTTRMKAVRLGNVFGSEGSIVPLFRQQILSGGPVTVTHPDVRRYFLTTEDAVTLLLASSAEMAPGILVPELGEPVPVQAVARHLIAREQSQAAIIFTQLRPGDKLTEALLSACESYVGAAGSLLRSVSSPALPAALLDDVLAQLQQACRSRSLTRLLAAVTRAVPGYRPSALIQSALA
jgi:FlaA1/EpsC-like NDP-sugar epimerase